MSNFNIKVGDVVFIDVEPMLGETQPDMQYNGETGIVVQVHRGHVVVLLSSGYRRNFQNSAVRLLGERGPRSS